MDCYYCNRPITNANRSREHIINQSIGGHVTSGELLCKSCNNSLGDSIDVELNRQLGPYGFLLNIPLQNGPHKEFIEMISKAGKIIRVRPGMIPFDIVRLLDLKPTPIEISVAPEKFHDMMERKKRELKLLFHIESRVYEIPPSDEKYYIFDDRNRSPDETYFGGDVFYRAIAKIMVNYFLMNKYPSSIVQSAINFIKGNADQLMLHYQPQGQPVHLTSGDEVSHILHLNGDPQNGLLYGYIELFNMIKLVIPFSFEYYGPLIDKTYSWDVVNGKEMNKRLTLPIAPHHIELLEADQVRMIERVSHCRERLMAIIAKRHRILCNATEVESQFSKPNKI